MFIYQNLISYPIIWCVLHVLHSAYSNMADLSLDEIIAKKKGQKRFKVQFMNRDGKPAQRFASKMGQQGGFQQKKSQVKRAPAPARLQRGPTTYSNIPPLMGPGKGQIDARDMITIKTRKKMSDARVKIVQKRIGNRMFDARSKLQPRNRVGQHQQQRQPLFTGALPRQQLQKQQQQAFSGTQQQQGFQNPLKFQVTNVSNPDRPPSLLQLNVSKPRTDLLNFTVAVNSSVPSSGSSALRPEPLTRTLQNPLANGGALVENTGSSLKITRAVPDVIFDGHSLTVTRRVPLSGKKPGSSHPDRGLDLGVSDGHGLTVTRRLPNSTKKQTSTPSSNASGPKMDSERGPIIQIHNDHFQPRPPQPSQPPPSNGSARSSRQGQQPQSAQRARAPSPIQPPVVSKRPPFKPSRGDDVVMKASTDTGYKVTKNTALFSSKTREEAPLDDRLRLRSTSPPRAKRSAKTTSQQPGTTNPKPSKSSQSVSKRLAPRPSASSGEGRSSGSSKALKRRAPMSLSERFSARESGSSSPVIVDLDSPKKRRMPNPEPEKEDSEDLEIKEGSEEEEVEEVALISPLQGFRMLVSNLHTSVTQDDIIELFGAIGPLKRANLLSKGQAEVAYIHREHAVLALKKYHNRELDGLPMLVKVTTPLNAQVMKTPAEDAGPGLPPSLRSNKKPPTGTQSAPVEIPLIHRALFKTGAESAPSKSVRFTVKL